MKFHQLHVLADLYEQWSSDIPLTAAVLSTLIALTRNLYYNDSTRHTVMESLGCGLMTYCFCNGLEFIGVPESISPAIGGVIGCLGAKRIRSFLTLFAKRKASGQ